MTGSRLDRIDGDVLAPIVQEALGSPRVGVTEWHHRILKGDGTATKRLVCPVFGRGRLQQRDVSWSVILKVPNPTQTHLDAWHREPFQREPLLYQSGLLDDLPGGICAPRCLGVTEHPDDEPWMWLEDVTGVPALEWPLERFGAAARHLGVLQGAFLAGKPLPDCPWLDSSGWLQAQLAASAEPIPAILERLEAHPLTGELCRSEFGKRVRRLWAERAAVFEALDRVPGSLCHGDFNYTNLFARRPPHGQDQTVAVDWQYAGLRQIGEDIAGLIADSSVIPVRRKAAEPEDFAELMLEGYLSGLREAGWPGGLRVARFACLARLALPWSFNLLRSLDGGVLRQPLCENSRPQLEEKLDQYIRRQELLLQLAEEARALLGLVRGAF